MVCWKINDMLDRADKYAQFLLNMFSKIRVLKKILKIEYLKPFTMARNFRMDFFRPSQSFRQDNLWQIEGQWGYLY